MATNKDARDIKTTLNKETKGKFELLDLSKKTLGHFVDENGELKAKTGNAFERLVGEKIYKWVGEVKIGGKKLVGSESRFANKFTVMLGHVMGKMAEGGKMTDADWNRHASFLGEITQSNKEIANTIISRLDTEINLLENILTPANLEILRADNGGRITPMEKQMNILKQYIKRSTGEDQDNNQKSKEITGVKLEDTISNNKTKEKEDNWLTRALKPLGSTGKKL